MLTETLSGKCPCCSYDKMLQRYGSIGYYQMEGCPKCGFGYGTNHHDGDSFGVGAWIDYARYILASLESQKYDSMFEDDPEIERAQDGCLKYNGGDTKENKAYNHAFKLINELPEDEVRKMIFDWSESQERSDDVDTTIFVYDEQDIDSYRQTQQKVF